MNCASARWTRATAPFSTTKRLPESLAAVSKSMPGLTAGNIEVLARGEGVGRGCSPAADFDVSGFVGTVGNLGQG